MMDTKIIKIAAQNSFYGLENIFTHKSSLKNNNCGDRIKLEIIIKRNLFHTMRYETEACVYCEATASIIAKKIKLFSLRNLKKEINLLQDLFSQKKPQVPKKFDEFTHILNQKNKKRKDCIMLPFYALLKAVKI